MENVSKDGVEFEVGDFGLIHRELGRFRKWKERSPMDRCLWWRSDCQKPIRSHSLSKCWLREIAPGGNAVVLRLNAEEVGKKPIQMRDQLAGVNQISTFKGFCSQHDNDIFKPIDNLDFLASKENCYRISYRSVCQAAASKFSAAGTQLQTSGVFGADLPSEFDLKTVTMMRQCMELLALKGEYETWFDDESICGPVEHFAMVVEPRLPFCGTVTFCPCITATGRHLTPTNAWMSMVVLPRKANSFVIFSVDRQHPKSANLVVKSWKSMPVAWIADILLKFMLEHGENLAFSPEWWTGLREGQRTDIRKRSFRNIRFASEEFPENLFRTLGNPYIPCSRVEWVDVR